MPPRIVVALIIAFWLGSTGWLLYHQWWRWLDTDLPPPISIDLADEALPQTGQWGMWLGEQKAGTAHTSTRCLKDLTIELKCSIERFNYDQRLLPIAVQIEIEKLETIERVDRDGKLISLDSKLERLHILGLHCDVSAHLVGKVKEGKLYARCSIVTDAGPGNPRGNGLPGLGEDELVLEPIELGSGSMLNPLQPMARMQVRPGQQWKITAVDPLAEAVKASLGRLVDMLLSGLKKGGVKSSGLRLPASEPSVILAEVLTEPQELIHQGKPVSCYVIEYHHSRDFSGSDFSGRTWVQVDGGKVLLQEATHQGEKIVLRRED